MLVLMSAPSPWDPPGRSHPPQPPPPAEAPTVRLPAVQEYPTPRYPTAQPPPERYPTARYPGADDHAYDDDRYYRADEDYDDRVDDRRPAPAARRPRRRGQAFALLVLLLALIDSAVLGLLVYQALAAIDLTSADPFGALGEQLATLGTVALGAVVVFVLALIALVVARPRALAALGLLAAVLLPIGGVLLGLWFGGDVLRQRTEATVAEGTAAVDRVVDELERRLLDLGPLRDLLPEGS